MHQDLAPTMADLLARFPRSGKIDWIGIRPARRQPLIALDEVNIGFDGLAGDHRKNPGKRAVTLIQAEHLPAIASMAGHAAIDPALLRRNILISGINLLALRDHTILVGSAKLRVTGPCAPCSRMEEYLGEGGYNAMRGHGGMTAEVLKEGICKIGDPVSALSIDTS